jgi:gas vesicle protein
MSENPDVIRADIEATRARLGTNVDAVADKVTPSHIVQRQTDRVKENVKDAVFGVKDKVMGAADHTADRVHSTTGSVGSHVSDAGSAVAGAPGQLKNRTQGNPLAAGLIAFGAGLLVSSLIPASQKEREAADALKSAAEPLTTELTDAAKQVAEGLKAPAQEAVENVKATAADATDHLKADGHAAVEDVKDRTAEAKDNVQQA